MAVVGIIQARVGSKRFPGKVLEKLGEHRIIDWVWGRVIQSELLDHIVLAIPNTAQNDVLAHGCAFNEVMRGEEDNVLSRFVQAADTFHADYVVRICADNPFVDPQELDRLIACYFFNRYDHVASVDDFGGEILSADLLRHIDREATSHYDREHVTTYLQNTGHTYKRHLLGQYSRFKLDVDTPEDLDRLRKLVPPITINSTAKEIIEAYQSIIG